MQFKKKKSFGREMRIFCLFCSNSRKWMTSRSRLKGSRRLQSNPGCFMWTLPVIGYLAADSRSRFYANLKSDINGNNKPETETWAIHQPGCRLWRWPRLHGFTCTRLLKIEQSGEGSRPLTVVGSNYKDAIKIRHRISKWNWLRKVDASLHQTSVATSRVRLTLELA